MTELHNLTMRQFEDLEIRGNVNSLIQDGVVGHNEYTNQRNNG